MWTPGDFEDYRALYPNTPQLDLPDMGLTARFGEAWTAWDDTELSARVRDALDGVSVRLVRGYLGNWMPGNLVGPERALKALGVDARIVRNKAGATVEQNAVWIGEQVDADGPILWLGHSKGGLEALCVASERDDTRGVLLSQTPRGPSGVLESLLLRTHDASLSGTKRWLEEWTQRIGIHAIGAAGGGKQLTGDTLDAVIARVDALETAFPVWQTASWSSQPTTWLDSFHGRLEEIRPGCAHDGQFFVEDLIWPDVPHVLLPHVDHAQPVMGGYGFDEVRYWLLLIALFADDPGAS